MNLGTKLLIAGAGIVCVTTVFADDKKKADLSRAGGTVDNVRQADPPQVRQSSGTSNAGDIARRENAAEQERQRERSRKARLDKGKVPPPGR